MSSTITSATAGASYPELPGAILSGDNPMDAVDLPRESSDILLTSGRRYTVEAGNDGDHLTVRGRGGAVVLRVLMTDAGPVLTFDSAELELTAARRLALAADHIDVHARRAMCTTVEGDMSRTVTGTQHTRVGGSARLEAAAIQAQSSEGAVEVRAAGRISLDGEHIGLNDDPCPRPFDWTALAAEES